MSSGTTGEGIELMRRFFVFLLICGTFLASSHLFIDTTARAGQFTTACNESALREALNAGGTIRLAENCLYRLTKNLPYLQTNTVIEGNGVAIDGQGTYRLLSSIAPTDITIHYLTLKNGAYGEGGALYVRQGTVTVVDSVFENNRALFGSGGAVWVNWGSVTISDSTFVNRRYGLESGVWTSPPAASPPTKRER